jgi:hypothetical protein
MKTGFAFSLIETANAAFWAASKSMVQYLLNGRQDMYLL